MGSDEVMRELREVGPEATRLEKLAAAKRARRNQLIMEAVAFGVPRAEIAVAADLSEPMLYKVKVQMTKKKTKKSE